jgi:hypothetical protein
VKVFISWSGDAAMEFALFLRDWLRHVVQVVKPFMSEQDISKGSRNVPEMSRELEATQFGIVVVTRHNLAAPWINFEAGAISRSVAGGRLVPLLLDIAKSEVVGPLAQFQAVDATDHNDVLRLFQEINRLLPDPLDNEILRQSVGDKLGMFDAAVNRYRQSSGHQHDGDERRSDRDVLREVLLIVRDLQRATFVPHTVPDEAVFRALAVAREELAPLVGWRDRMKQLDEALSIGLLTAEDYARRRAELLNETYGRITPRTEQGNEQE